MTVTGETSINGSLRKLGIVSKKKRRITTICILLLTEVNRPPHFYADSSLAERGITV
jgi:hypothetical protein